jgi:hypothetical protein
MYSGAGVTRAPQLCCISLVKLNEATDRTLRLYQGQTAIRYAFSALKQVTHTQLRQVQLLLNQQCHTLPGQIDFQRTSIKFQQSDEVSMSRVERNYLHFHNQSEAIACQGSHGGTWQCK